MMGYGEESRISRSRPEKQGVAPNGILTFLQAIEQKGLEVHSFMLVRHGHVIAETWWAPYARELPHMLYSLSKSFTSTAIGLAVAEKRLSLDDSVMSFFPEEVTPTVEENMKDLHIRHLLSMSTGHAVDTMGLIEGEPSGNWVKAFLNTPIVYQPGTHFLYNTGATYMLSAILQRVTGETLLDYLQPRLLRPLGITDATWETCPRGVNVGGFGLRVRTESIAKFGQLYLQQGQWNGEQILPAAWIQEATGLQIANGDDLSSDWTQGYGYQFWRCRHNSYRGDGAFGQFCVIMPEQDAVVAITSGSQDMGAILEEVWVHLLPAMSDTELPDSDEAFAELELRLQEVAISVPQLSGRPDIANLASWSGRWMEMRSNPQNLQSMMVKFEDNGFTVSFKEDEQVYVYEGNYDSWRKSLSTVLVYQTEEHLAVNGRWQDANTFVITNRLIETPHTQTFQISFGESGGHLSVQFSPSFHEGGEQYAFQGVWKSESRK